MPEEYKEIHQLLQGLAKKMMNGEVDIEETGYVFLTSEDGQFSANIHMIYPQLVSTLVSTGYANEVFRDAMFEAVSQLSLNNFLNGEERILN